MLYIVIPVFNRKDFTRDCLISLFSQSYKKFKVIVVDAGSTDGTEDMLREKFPEVIVLKGDGNLFWTASTNLGIQYALDHGATSVMTLNNDVIALEDFVEKMLYWHQQYPKALLGAVALDANTKKMIFAGEVLDWKTNTSRYLLNTLAEKDRKGIHEVTFFPGRGLLIPREVFLRIGLFDQRKFPHYYADYDFSSQARIAGFKVYCNFDARLYTYPEESGDIKNRKRKSVKSYYNHLFGIKGGGNLINFTRFTFRNCPTPYIPYYLANGYVKRIFGYFVK
jgi:GT2 family glycosyltransferase